MKKIILLLFLTVFLCSCSVLSQNGIQIGSAPDLESTVHWMVDDAVMAVSTQVVYQMRMEISTMIPATATPTNTYVVPVENTPTMTSIWQGQHRNEEATPTEPPLDCINKVKFVEDITIPDGTYVSAGKPFTKTWRLQNVGSCIWNDGYRFEFIDGNQMGANPSIPFPRDIIVKPNETFEISVYMTAPTTPGRYQGNWKITSPSGEKFGTGDKGDQAVWVKVNVQ